MKNNGWFFQLFCSRISDCNTIAFQNFYFLKFFDSKVLKRRNVPEESGNILTCIKEAKMCMVAVRMRNQPRSVQVGQSARLRIYKSSHKVRRGEVFVSTPRFLEKKEFPRLEPVTIALAPFVLYSRALKTSRIPVVLRWSKNFTKRFWNF